MRVTTRTGSAAACASLLAVVVSWAAPVAARVAATPGLPPRLADYVTRHARLSSDEQARLLQGQPVTKLLDADPSKEVAVFGAVWVNAPAARYVAAVKDIENFEKGENFLVTKRISSPPTIEDFDALVVPKDDLADLRHCKVGDCELKVGEAALARMQKTVNWSSPTADADVQRFVRGLALDYVKAYLEGGNDQLAVYRDSDRPTFVAKEFASMIDRMPSLTEYLPDVKRYLLDYPKATLPNSESFLYWQEAKFGLKPTIRINHLTIADEKTHVVIASKMLYASHYFWTAVELRVLLPDPSRGNGFWFVSVNQSRSDGLSGFVGSLIRGKVRGEAEKGMLAALQGTKDSLESPR